MFSDKLIHSVVVDGKKMIARKSQSYVLVPVIGVVVVDGMDWLRKQVGVNVLSSKSGYFLEQSCGT